MTEADVDDDLDYESSGETVGDLVKEASPECVFLDGVDSTRALMVGRHGLTAVCEKHAKLLLAKDHKTLCSNCMVPLTSYALKKPVEGYVHLETCKYYVKED